MKRMLILLAMLLSLCGCTGRSESVEPGMKLRQKITNGNGCSFDTVVTADYSDKIYTFRMHCESDKSGNLEFTVAEPATIAGIQGTITDAEGTLRFDDQVLAFQLLADEQISPVSGPWLFIKAIQSGYIRACETDKDGVHLIIDDIFKERNMQIDVYLSADHVPLQGDILWNGRRIISLQVENFHVL